MADNLSFLRNTLTKIFGISADSVGSFINQLQAAGEISSVDNATVQQHIGSRAHSFVTSALRIASEQSKHKSKAGGNKSGDEEDVKEGLSFTDYLLSETMVDIDLDNLSGTQSELRRKARLNKSNPQRLATQNQQIARDERAAAQQQTGPRASIQRQIADLKLKLAGLQKRLSSMPQTESEEYETFVPVLENEHGEIFEFEDILEESALRQYKRFGNTMKIRYRCATGQRTGKIVSQPSSCAQRKDPLKVRHGRKVMRSKKGTIARKSRITKGKAISKTLTKMNKRLSGD